MIGSQPIASLAPLDYRYALDAGMPLLGRKAAPLIRCNVRELAGEVRQRIPGWAEMRVAPAGLWVEPLARTWRTELQDFADILSVGAPLVIVASRPLAIMLPERRSWSGQPLGLRPYGISELCRSMPRLGFALEASYGIHTALAIGLNSLSRWMERCGRPDMGDRLHFAARLRYCLTGPFATLSTVALLIARKDSGEC